MVVMVNTKDKAIRCLNSGQTILYKAPDNEIRIMKNGQGYEFTVEFKNGRKEASEINSDVANVIIECLLGREGSMFAY